MKTPSATPSPPDPACRAPTIEAPKLVAPQLVAHRGNAREFPENTVASLRSAMEIGARYVEFDVHLAADEVPVVIHDHTLARTAGRPESVFELDAADLIRIGAGERSRFGDRFTDIRIPSLEQVAALLASYPHVTAFVEIKRESLRRFGTVKVVSRIMETIRPIRTQCVVISFDLPAVCHARSSAAASIGWVLDHYDERSKLKYEATRPEFLFCDHACLPKDGERLWRGPWHWAVYEIQTLEAAMALAARGVGFVESMAVGPMLKALKLQRGAG